MTVIIATPSGIWADRRVTDSGGTVWRPMTKVARNEALIAAFSGASGKSEKALALVRDGETDPRAIALVCDSGIVVDSKGMWELDSGSAVKVPKRFPFAVAGSGHAEAAAFLSGANSVDPMVIKRALRYVAKVRYDCGDGIDGLLL